MYRYTLYGFTIESDIDFPQLIECNNNDLPVDITISSGEIPEELLEQEKVGKKCYFSETFCWLINSYIYITVIDGNKITYKLKANHKNERNYLLGWGMSMICLEQKTPAIHCSAITDGAYAYLICGESGSGKSTVTESLIERGYKFMADDVIRVATNEIGIPFAYPCFPYRKLCRDAAIRSGYNLNKLIYIDEDKDKFLVPSHDYFYKDPLPVKSLIILGKNTTNDILYASMDGLKAFHACVGNLFLRHLLKDQKYEPFCAQSCLKIASKIDCHYLSRPEGRDSLEEMISKITSLLK